MRVPAALLIALVCVLLAGCGSSGEQGGSATETTPPPVAGTIESLWREPGDDIALTPGTSDYGPGRNRVSFLVVASDGTLVEQPSAKVWVARNLKEAPFLETEARLEPIGVPGGDKADAANLYVTDVKLPGPGKYWLLAEPVGGERRVQALGNLVVGKRAAAPAPGERAVAVGNPTLDSVAGELQALTTARRPDRELYRTTVRQALAEKQPFVVSFATPAFCKSRTCGPVVDVLSAVRQRFAGRPVSFIHVEIYEGNDPANGVNAFVDAWNLPTEPFTFVVDAGGVVRTKLEGAFSAGELTRAVRAVLARSR
ncbi:MAG: TlpA family protein disulfide reductase [Gaiella sp.]